jgi:putative ABC transport system permease protein
MRWLTQIGALVAFNLRTLSARKGSAASAVFGIAGVVAVLVGVLSIGRGFNKALAVNGSPERAIVLRSGADTELTSVLMRSESHVIADAPGVMRIGGRPAVSRELFVIINLPKKTTGTDANISLRGIDRDGLTVHDEVHVVEGRPFAWGTSEVIVGRGAQREFAGLDLGSVLRVGSNRWKVVGIFESRGGIAESEIWTDVEVLGPAYQRGASYQSALVRLASAGSFQRFKDALTSDPRVNLRVLREPEYYAEQSRVTTLIIVGLATVISGLMAVGAVFGALNTMYTAVAARAREIATLEAIGFAGTPVMISVLIESMLLALAGGILGALIAWAAVDGLQTATMNFQTFSQVTFSLDVDLYLLVRGIAWALVIGFAGGLFPAIRAARLPVADALRAR